MLKMWSAFFVSSKLTDLKDFIVNRFPNISVSFKRANMVDHILKFPKLVVLIINCLSWNTTKNVVKAVKQNMERRERIVEARKPSERHGDAFEKV